MIERLRLKLTKLPNTPGVYEFLNRKKQIIYVGKAANLKDRVRSYFSSHGLAPMKRAMLQEISDINWIITDSEIEALLLEANLIKTLKPRYNVVLRDDKSYVYIKVSTEEEWPRVLTTRRIDKSGTYFGPFTSAHAVKETLRVLRKIIPYRCNQKPIDTQRTGLCNTEARPPSVRPCFWYHLGRCPGTCVGAISKAEYRKNIRRIILFLGGKMDTLRRAMKKELGPQRIELMENVLAHTRVLSVTEKYAGDVKELARILHLPKSPQRIEGYDISNIMGRQATGAMVVFHDGEPEKSEYKRFKIKTVHGANDIQMLEEVLERRVRHSIANSKSQARNPKQIQNLKSKILNLKSAVWPMPDLIIIDGGKAQLNAAARALRSFQGSSRLQYKTSTSSVGTWQASSNNIALIAIAKGGHGGVLKQKEEMYFPGEKKPLKLPNNSPALHLILRVRDEAHRFAVGYHKVLRRKKMYR